MPVDNVKNRTFKEMLGGTVRFCVPFFQRGYAWEKKQWDQLFLDLQEQMLDELHSGSALSEVEHFFGPIVVMEQTGNTELKEFLIIDGQQRITTVYLLLALIREQLRAKKHLSVDAGVHAEDLTRYLTNDVSGSDEYLKLKVFSSKGDRLPTYRLVFATDINPKTPLLATDVQLYVPGSNGVDEFKKYASRKLKAAYSDVPALWQLAQVLLNCLKIVWIPLDQQKDDAQAIFESLNDKGMPLSASELLCNYLFRPIIDAKDGAEELHNSHWLAAVNLLRADGAFEEYLRSLFSIGENKMVGKNRKVYVHFKNKHRGLTSMMAKEHLSRIHQGATFFRSILEPVGYPHSVDAVNRVLIDIGSTRMASCTPFVLSVLLAHAAGQLSEEGACAILRETLVLLVRRKLAELSTTQYDTMFPSLLGSIVGESNHIRALHDRFKKHALWVSNQEFEDAFEQGPVYRRNDLSFSRMILVGIDRQLQKHGQLPDYSTVGTIEHMIPQTLDTQWRTYLGSEAESEHLEAAIQSIGNLCLLSSPANSAVGQDPFESKRSAYSPLTALARQFGEHEGRWDLKAVRSRSRQLGEVAALVWGWAPE